MRMRKVVIIPVNHVVVSDKNITRMIVRRKKQRYRNIIKAFYVQNLTLLFKYKERDFWGVYNEN